MRCAECAHGQAKAPGNPRLDRTLALMAAHATAVPSDFRSAQGDRRLINRRMLRALVPVSDMTIWRWMQAGHFPPPIKIHGRNYWWLDEALAALESVPSSSSKER